MLFSGGMGWGKGGGGGGGGVFFFLSFSLGYSSLFFFFGVSGPVYLNCEIQTSLLNFLSTGEHKVSSFSHKYTSEHNRD